MRSTLEGYGLFELFWLFLGRRLSRQSSLHRRRLWTAIVFGRKFGRQFVEWMLIGW